MPISVAQFLERLSESDLFSPDDVAALTARFPKNKRFQDAEPVLTELVEAEKLTRFQADALVADFGRNLVMGDYVILREIGVGGMGRVYQARHRRLKRVVALKVMAPNFSQNEAAIKRFQREMEAAARLSHPNIVATYDAREHKGCHYLVMEYVAGDNLANVVKKQGPLPVDAAVDYMLQAARGLAHAHLQGVVHRDIKPANLLLDPEGRVKILDMGIARFEGGAAVSGITQTGSLMGTAAYMAPEQALDVRKADARSDVYSLGCTLFYLLTAREVYPADTYMRQVMAHREEPIPSLAAFRPDVSSGLAAVFQKMVAKKPADRFQSMDKVSAALSACRGFVAPKPAAVSDSIRRLLDPGEAPSDRPSTRGRAPSKTVPEDVSHHQKARQDPPVKPLVPQDEHIHPAPQRSPPEPLPPSIAIDEPSTGGVVQAGTVMFTRPNRTFAEGHETLGPTAPGAQARFDPDATHSDADSNSVVTVPPENKPAAPNRRPEQVGTAPRRIFAKTVATALLIVSAGSLAAVLYFAVRLPPEKPAENSKVAEKPEQPPAKTEAPRKKPAKTTAPKVTPPAVDNMAERLAGEARTLAVGARLAWLQAESELPAAFHPPVANDAAASWQTAEADFIAGSFSTAESAFKEAGRLFAEANTEAAKTSELLEAASGELVKLEEKRKAWQTISKGIAENKVPPSAGLAEQAYRLAQESVAQRTGLSDVPGHAAKANKHYDEAIVAVSRERQTVLGAARQRAQAAYDEAQQRLSKSPSGVMEIYNSHAPAKALAGKAAAALKQGDDLAAASDTSALASFTQAEESASQLTVWLTSIAEAVSDLGRVQEQVDALSKKQPNAKLDLLAWPKSRWKLASDYAKGGDANRALAESKVVAALLPKIDEALQKRPRLPLNTAVGAFAESAARRTQGDESLRSGRPAEAEKLYNESRGLYPALKAPHDALAARRHQKDWAAALGVVEIETNSVGQKLALIPPGAFEMGTSERELQRLLDSDPELKRESFKGEQPQRRVSVQRPFRLAAYETTQGEFEQVLGRNPSWATPGRLGVKETKRFPVENISWFDAAEFCNELSRREGLPEFYTLARGENGRIQDALVPDTQGRGYRLPTEAEWEYACRAGSGSSYHFGDALDGREANVDGDFPFGASAPGQNLRRTAVVGSYAANPFGLCDMHGNVWEWCHDDVGEGKKLRAVRGGSFVNLARNARSAARSGYEAGFHDLHIGFRVARSE